MCICSQIHISHLICIMIKIWIVFEYDFYLKFVGINILTSFVLLVIVSKTKNKSLKFKIYLKGPNRGQKKIHISCILVPWPRKMMSKWNINSFFALNKPQQLKSLCYKSPRKGHRGQIVSHKKSHRWQMSPSKHVT